MQSEPELHERETDEGPRSGDESTFSPFLSPSKGKMGSPRQIIPSLSPSLSHAMGPSRTTSAITSSSSFQTKPANRIVSASQMTTSRTTNTAPTTGPSRTVTAREAIPSPSSIPPKRQAVLVPPIRSSSVTSQQDRGALQVVSERSPPNTGLGHRSVATNDTPVTNQVNALQVVDLYLLLTNCRPRHSLALPLRSPA